MVRDLSPVISDMLETITRLGLVTSGKTLLDFEADWQLQFIVQRGIEIISEASRSIPDELKNEHPHIRWIRVRDVGNVLRHRYEIVSIPLVWNIVIDELPILRKALEAMASRPNP
jgi:uncharacterized protein with HEPN domain